MIEVNYDVNGNVIDEGSLEDQSSIQYLSQLPPNEDGCPAIGLTTHCTVAFDQLGRSYAVAFNGGNVAIGVQDPNSQFWGFNYNSNINLILVADPNSHAWGFSYDSTAGAPDQNDLKTVSDQNGNTTTVDYTPAGTNGGLVSSVQNAVGGTTTFSGWNVSAEQAGDPTVTTEINPDGQTVSYQYEFYELDIVTTTANSGDSHYTASTVHDYYTTGGTPPLPYEVTTDPSGYSTTDFTDNVGNVIEQADNYGNTYTAYNSFDEPCWVAPPGVTVPNPSYPSCASPPTAGSGSTFYSYDTYGDQTEVTDPMGNITYSGYNSYGELCWQTTPGTSISGPTCASPPAASTRYNYNAGAELLAESTPDGIGSSYTYDTTTYTYNPYGEVSTEITPDGNVAGGTPANYTTTDYYDNAGRLYKTVAPMGRTTIATLDAVGNVTALTDPIGNVTSAAYDADNRQCWSYQGSAGPVCGSPPAGSTRYAYNANTADPLTVTDPDNHVTTYTYADPRVPDDPTTVTDALNNVTSNVYDKDGNLCVTGTTSVSLYAASDPNCVWPTAGDTPTMCSISWATF